MIPYIIKSTLCSAILIAIYYLFLEKEKMYRFNRFFLIFASGFSFIIPLITIRTMVPVLPVIATTSLTNPGLQNALFKQSAQLEPGFIDLVDYLVIVYALVATIQFSRFFKSALAIYKKIKNNNKIPFFDSELVLINDNLAPHSFLKYIFIPGAHYKSGMIEKEVITHELTHARQKHSIDILYFELLLVIAWFNPLLYFYKKAIQLNHEFSADESVVNKSGDVLNYQRLLLYKATQNNSLLLSSPFNYLLIKKRIIMMNKKSSDKITIFKQLALVPIIVAIGFIFTAKIVARDLSKTVQDQSITTSTRDGVSQELLSEYKNIISKYITTDTTGKVVLRSGTTSAEMERLETIYNQMNKEQQSGQKFVPVPYSSLILKSVVPTSEQFESWKDNKIYGVWINNQRVANDVLNFHTNTDFAHFFESKLMKNAKNYGEHYYQVNLMTNDYYQDYFNNTMAKGGSILLPAIYNR